MIYLSFEDDELLLKRADIAEFDRDFKPMDYDAKTAAKKLLSSSRFTNILPKAREALQRIIDGKEPKKMSSKDLKEQGGTTLGADIAKAADSVAAGKKERRTKVQSPDVDGRTAKGGKKAKPVKGKAAATAVSGQRPGSGAYIRELLMTGKHDPDSIVKLTHKKFPDSKCSVKDVAWNRAKLRRDGVEVPEVE